MKALVLAVARRSVVHARVARCRGAEGRLRGAAAEVRAGALLPPGGGLGPRARRCVRRAGTSREADGARQVGDACGALPTNTNGCTFTPCYRFNLPCALRSGEPATRRRGDDHRLEEAGRLRPVVDVPAGTPPPAGFTTAPRYLARYWLFYEFDDWRSPTGTAVAGARGRLGERHRRASAMRCSRSSPHTASIAPGRSAHGRTSRSAAVAPSTTSQSARTRTTSRTRRRRRSSTSAATDTSTGSAREDARQARRGPHRRSHRHSARVRPRRRLRDDAARARRAEGAAARRGRRSRDCWSEGQLLWIGRTPTRLTSIFESGGPATPNWNATSIPSGWHAASS